ncbi:MAG: hypothetical protein LQ340_006671, partial [Diploschistes diacapsis]
MHDPKYSKDEKEAMYLVTAIIAGGRDKNDHDIPKAREELDNVCGADAERLPRLDDIRHLPYISATIKERLRWRPVLPLIPQHRLTEDLEFEGRYFPAGPDFVINSLAVNAECEELAILKPERWMDERVFNVVSGLWQFGGGRRVCVGYAMAHQELFLATRALN